MATQFRRFSSPLSRQVNASVTGIVAQMNAYFDANQRIILSDAGTFTRGYDETSYGLSVTLMVQVPPADAANRAGFWYLANYVVGQPGGPTAEAQMSALLADVAYEYATMITLSGIRPGRAAQDDWILIRSRTTDRPSSLGVPTEAAIGAPLASIAAGAVGSATLWNARGLPLPGSYDVRNLSGIAWAAGDRNYVYWDQFSGTLCGLPACGPIVPLTTTTSTGPI